MAKESRDIKIGETAVKQLTTLLTITYPNITKYNEMESRIEKHESTLLDSKVERRDMKLAKSRQKSFMKFFIDSCLPAQELLPGFIRRAQSILP